MTGATGNHLFKALADLQADLPKVGKGATAQYGKYADLADVSAVVLPLLGKHGLVFTARPTMIDGSFVLAYSLAHVSGEREDGFYPLPANGTSQQLGSAITYARRYSLCAVTGVAPDEDDDGAAANGSPWQGRQQSDWDRSTPAPPRQAGNNRPQQRASRPAAVQQAPAASETAGGEVDKDAQALADEAFDAETLHDLDGIRDRADRDKKLDALVLNPSSNGTGKPGALRVYLDWKRTQVTPKAVAS